MAPELEQRIDRILDEGWRTKVDALTTELADRLRAELSVLLEQSTSTVAAAAREEARQEAEIESRQQRASLLSGLSQAVREIRSADSVTGIASSLVDGAARFCGRSALLIHKGDSLLGFRLAGAADHGAREAFQRLSINIREAASFAHAIDTVDQVLSSGSAHDLSGRLTELFGLRDEDRVLVVPVKLRDKVLALLYCDSKGPEGVGKAGRDGPHRDADVTGRSLDRGGQHPPQNQRGLRPNSHRNRRPRPQAPLQ